MPLLIALGHGGRVRKVILLAVCFMVSGCMSVPCRPDGAFDPKVLATSCLLGKGIIAGSMFVEHLVPTNDIDVVSFYKAHENQALADMPGGPLIARVHIHDVIRIQTFGDRNTPLSGEQSQLEHAVVTATTWASGKGALPSRYVVEAIRMPKGHTSVFFTYGDSLGDDFVVSFPEDMVLFGGGL